MNLIVRLPDFRLAAIWLTWFVLLSRIRVATSFLSDRNLDQCCSLPVSLT